MLAYNRVYVLLGTVGLATFINISFGVQMNIFGLNYILKSLICSIQVIANFQMLVGEFYRNRISNKILKAFIYNIN